MASDEIKIKKEVAMTTSKASSQLRYEVSTISNPFFGNESATVAKEDKIHLSVDGEEVAVICYSGEDDTIKHDSLTCGQ